MLRWLRNRKRRQLVAEAFPDEWLAWMRLHLPQYDSLAGEEQAKLCDDVRVFVAEKYWEGCAGLELTNEMKVAVAAAACLLVLRLDNDLYPSVRSIFLYPSGYWAPERSVGPGGVVTEGRTARLGEAWQSGPVVLSWHEEGAEGADEPRAETRRLIFHEFAHQLDMADRRADGMPRLPSDEAYERWVGVIRAEYHRFQRESRLGGPHVLDPYGAESYAEFFAVATEAFFERPRDLHACHPRLYDLLRGYYGQDPAGGA